MKQTSYIFLSCILGLHLFAEDKKALPPTENLSTHYEAIDTWDPATLVNRIIESNQEAVHAVSKASSQIEEAADAIVERLQQGGRLIYVGAGTSGRLGTLDAAELPPTFSWPKNRALHLIAGGDIALSGTVKFMEDDTAQALTDFAALEPQKEDVVIGIAASGRTPYVVTIIENANELGALTVGISSWEAGPLLSKAQKKIFLDTGAEPVQGSTRMKAGTAQTVTLKTLSTTVMVRLGHVFNGMMVHLGGRNQKFDERRLRITQQLTGLEANEAQALLEASGWDNRTAYLMHSQDLSREEAEAELEHCHGNLGACVEALESETQ